MFMIDIPRIAVAYPDTALFLKAEYMDKCPVIFADNYADFYDNTVYSYVIDPDMMSDNSILEIFYRSSFEREFAIVVTENPKLIELLGLIEYRGGDVFADACTAKPVEFESYDVMTLNMPFPVTISLPDRLPKNDMDIFARFGGQFTSDISAQKVILTDDTDIEIQHKMVLAMADGYNTILRKMAEHRVVIEDYTLRFERNGIKYGYFEAPCDSVLWIQGEVIYFTTAEKQPEMICKDDILALNFIVSFESDKHWAKRFCEL